MPWLFVLFVAVPIAEIALFIVVGERLGLGSTIVIVVMTALLGATLVSRQGRSQMTQIRRSTASGAFPAVELAHGAMILVAGALLITPGFLTDTIGFLLLVPQFREMVRRVWSRRMRDRVQIL
jgi:UPF0716 protein FxsA